MHYKRSLCSLSCSYASFFFFLLPLSVLVVVSLLLGLLIVKSIVHCPWLVLLQSDNTCCICPNAIAMAKFIGFNMCMPCVFECFVFFSHPTMKPSSRYEYSMHIELFEYAYFTFFFICIHAHE